MMRRMMMTAMLTVMNVGPLSAQHAKPPFKTIAPAEAIRLYWSDALNQFKGVRASTSHDADPPGLYSTVRYDLLTVPTGAIVWDEVGDHPLVTEKRGRGELREGMPQVDLGLFLARLPNRAAAERLYNELKPVVLSLPGAALRGEQYPFYTSVGVRARPGRRVMTLQLSDEPDDPETGAYFLSLDVSFNLDDPSWDGGEGTAAGTPLVREEPRRSTPPARRRD